MNIKIILLLLISLHINALEGIDKAYGGLGLNIGPSFSYIDENNGTALNLDIALSNIIPNDITMFTFSVNNKYVFNDKQNYYAIEAEATVVILFILGGGIGYYKENDEFKRKYHYFIGLPVLSIADINMFFGKGSFFIEPYVRIHKFPNEYVNEYGIFLKISTHEGINVTYWKPRKRAYLNNQLN